MIRPIATISWRVKSMSIKIDNQNQTKPKDQCEARKDYGYPISIAIHRLLFFKLEFFCLVKLLQLFCIFPENYPRLPENQIIGLILNKWKKWVQSNITWFEFYHSSKYIQLTEVKKTIEKLEKWKLSST